ncbi:MAG TPA: ABC transporter permease [Pyrinomonadaceae bacterium]|nr:ABC transporter permease [Pyrinomonadaceae bacterium]
MNPGVVAAITRKDVVDAIRNRYLLTALITPLFLAVLFRILLPGPNPRNLLTVVVYDPANSVVVAAIRQAQEMSVVDAPSPDAIASEVQKRKAIAGLVVPPNFDADLTAGKQPQLSVYLNNGKTIFEQAAFRRLLDQHIKAVVKQPEPVRLVWIDIDKSATEQSGVAGGLAQMLLPLLLIMTLGMIGSMVVPLLLVEEKEKRTLDFLLASPASLKEIVAGKAVTGVVYTFLIAGLLLIVNRQFVGNWLWTSVTIVLGLVFVVGIGLLLGSFLNNTMQVNTWASSVLLLLLAPSFPSLGLPAFLDTALRFVPTYYLSEALKLSLGGSGLSRIWGHLTVVFVCSAIAFSASAWALHRRH